MHFRSFVPARNIERVARIGVEIQEAERRQVSRIREGVSFRQQARFDIYLRERNKSPSLTFGEHLRAC